MRIFTRNFICGTIASFLVYANYFMLMVTITGFSMERLGAGADLGGFATSVFLIGTLFARFVSPAAMRVAGYKPVALAACICVIIASAAYVFTPCLAALFLLRFLHGAFFGFAQAAITMLVTCSLPEDRHGEGVGYYMLSVTAGSAIGPFVGIILSQNAGYTVLFLVDAAVAVAAFAFVAFMPARAKRVFDLMPSNDETDKQDEVYEAPKEERDGSSFEASGAAGKDRRWVHAFIETSALGITAVAALLYLGYGAVVSYLELFAQQRELVGAASFFFIVYAVAMFLTRPLTGKWFDRSGAKPVILMGCIATSVGLALIAVALNPAFLLAGAAFLGIGIGAVQPSGLAYALRNAAPDRLEVANSTYFIGLDMAVGLAPLLLGWCIPLIGYQGMYIAVACIAVLDIFLSLKATRKKK